MFEDKRLIWKFKRGYQDAGLRIYEKYKHDMLGLATVLLHDKSLAEDIAQQVFIAFAEKINDFQLRGSLKAYLAICISNRVRNANKAKHHTNVSLENAIDIPSQTPDPEGMAIYKEELRRLEEMLECLPYEQKETIILHIKGSMTFKDIAHIQDVSINTVQSRYRYGLEKLRSLLDGEVTQ